MNETRTQRTLNRLKRWNMWARVLLVLFVINSVGVVLGYFFVIPEMKYRRATELLESGQYDAAIELFSELGTYRTSAAQLSLVYAMANRNISMGSTVYYGIYDQDANPESGRDKIAWRVLALNEGRALLISQKNLDTVPYHETDEPISWESCSLRAWLNDRFFAEAFNEHEQAGIIATETERINSGGEDDDVALFTKDRVFLLDVAEAQKYFNNDRDRIAANTGYAVRKNALDSPEGNGWWWLRSPGHEEGLAANVNYSGTIDEYGNYVYSVGGCVRPAIWIDLKAIEH